MCLTAFFSNNKKYENTQKKRTDCVEQGGDDLDLDSHVEFSSGGGERRRRKKRGEGVIATAATVKLACSLSTC